MIDSDISFNEARDLLRELREKNERKSDVVVSLWTTIIKQNLKKFGTEKNLVLEQVLIAALDCHDYELAADCNYILFCEFPGSKRIMNYRSAWYEAKGNYDVALKLLDSSLPAQETNFAARKRKIAILKSQGLIAETIKELVEYLKKCMADVEAWQELCELYLQVQEYSRAAFCAEELILHQPHNHLMHQRLADIRYTMGGVENYELAKSYYSQALKLNPNNIRALLGLFLVTTNLLNHYKSSGNSSKRKEVWKLNQWALTQASDRQLETLDKKSEADPDLVHMMLLLAVNE